MTITNKRKTKHGLIDIETGVYLTHRQPQHLFRKFGSFNISKTEIEKALQYNCSIVRIKYFSKERNTIYEFNLSKLKDCREWTHLGDEQYVLRIDDMIKKGYEEVREGETFIGYIEHFKNYIEA